MEKSSGDGRVWDALLSQARANEALSRALLDCTKCMVNGEGAVDLELDRLESWFAANDDAEVGVSVAAQAAQQAEEIWQEVRAEPCSPAVRGAIPSSFFHGTASDHDSRASSEDQWASCCHEDELNRGLRLQRVVEVEARRNDKPQADEEEQSGRGLLHSLSQAGIEPKPEGGWASTQPMHSNSTITDELGKARLEKLTETLSAKMQRRRAALGDDSDFEAEALRAKARQEAKDLHDRLDAESRDLHAEVRKQEAEVRNLHAKRSELQSQKQSSSASSDQPDWPNLLGNIAPKAKKKKGARGRYC